MPFISLELAKVISDDETDLINLVIHIASSTGTVFSYFEVETASIVLAKIFQKIYNIVPYPTLLNECFTKKHITILSKKIYIADKELFLVILLNSIRTSDDVSKTEITEVPECIITNILKCLNVEKKYTALLLRTLNYILSKTRYISPFLCEKIILEMQKVALSPLTGFKRVAGEVSQTVLSLLNDEAKKLLCNIDLIPFRGIDTMDLVTLCPGEFVKDNKILIVRKVCFLFKNNLENKDGEALYKRLILFYSFEEWKEEIWPIFLPFLQKINTSGEFFQSLLKYWITTNVKEYKSVFYFFMETQQIDNIFKVYTYLETCRNGFISEHIHKETFFDIGTVNFKLRIISTYYKKTLVPGQKEQEIFLEFLYANLNYFLDIEVIKNVGMFLSQLFLYAHNDLKKSTKQLELYSEFLHKLYRFCYGIIGTELYEVGIQVLQILLCVSKGGSCKNLHLAYKLEKIDYYDEGENLLYITLKNENKWNFEDNELMTRLKLCLEKNQGCSRLLIDLIRNHYPVTYFFSVDSFRDILKSAENEPFLQTYDKISNLSLLLFKITDIEELQMYIDKLTEELMLIIINENIHSHNNLHKATLRLITLVNAFEESFLVKDYGLIICRCLATFKDLLISSSSNGPELCSVKILESFVNNVTCGLNRHLDLIWDNLDKEFIVRTVIAIIEKSNMRRPIMLNEALLKKLSKKMETQEEETLLKIKIFEETLDKLFRMKEYKDYKIRRNPESRLVLHALCSQERSSEKPLLRWVLRFLLEVLNDNASSEESLTAAYHCLEIFVSDKTLHESTLEFIPEIIKNSVEGFINLSWAVRNANLQLTKALIERMYGVSLGLWNRLKDVSDLFQLYPQLSGYFFKIVTSENLDERAHIVFQYFLESQVKEKIFSKTFMRISSYFQQIFINIIKEYGHHYGKLAVHSFVALCSVHDIPAVICDIKDFIEKNAAYIRKNILSNLILLLQELYYKFRISFKCTMDAKQIKKMQNYLQDLSRFLKLSDLSYFYPILFDATSLQDNLNKVKNLNCEHFQQDRKWLYNNLHFLILHSKPIDVVNVCDVLFSNKLPIFAQIKILSILMYRYEKQNFAIEDIKNILKILFRSAVMVTDKEIFLLQSFLRVLTVFSHNLLVLDIKIQSKIELAYSGCLYRSLIFLLNNFLSTKLLENKNLNVCDTTIEQQILQSLGVSEDTDHDILSVLVYFYKMSSDCNSILIFFKLIFYFCTNESTYLDAYYLGSFIMSKKYCSILSLLKDLFHYDNLRLSCRHSDIVNLYKDLNLSLKKESAGFNNRNNFYEIEGDDLIPRDIQKMLLRYFESQMYLNQ